MREMYGRRTIKIQMAYFNIDDWGHALGARNTAKIKNNLRTFEERINIAEQFAEEGSYLYPLRIKYTKVGKWTKITQCGDRCNIVGYKYRQSQQVYYQSILKYILNQIMKLVRI